MKARLAVLVALSCSLSLPARAYADGPEATPPTEAAQNEGREHFNRGLTLYRERNFGGARVEFQRAYDVAPSFRILFNLGEAAFELQDYAGAIDTFERYLKLGGDRVPPDRRAEVLRSLADLEQRVGRLEISTNVPGADVTVDGVSVGKSPLPLPVVVSVGHRVVSASIVDRLPASKAVDVAGGDHGRVTLELVAPAPAPVVAALPPVVPHEPAPAPRSMTPVWVSGGVTGAVLVTSVAFGVLTVQANNSYNAELARFPGSATAIANARSEVHAYALVTDVSGGIAIAGAALTTYLAVSRSRSRPASAVAAALRSGGFRIDF